MIDKWLSKSKLKNGIEKLANKLLLGKISANQLTLTGLLIGLLSSFFIFLSGILLWKLELIVCSIVLMVISFLFDALDGTVARLEEPTTFGGILDIFCDRTVEVSIIIALISTDPLILMWPGIFSLGAVILCITMFLLVGGSVKAKDLEESKKVIYYRHGLMERSETLLFLLFTTIFIVWRFFLLWVFAALVFITALLRLRDANIIFKTGKVI